jgi:hypothetical protein
MTGAIYIWIPRRAPNLNDLFRAKGAGPYAYNRLKVAWAETVKVCCIGARGVPFGQRTDVHFELVEPDRRRDPDNIASAASKLILDGLVKAGVIDGDGWQHITGLSFSWRVGSPAGVRVVLSPSAVISNQVGTEGEQVNG